jgi:hypothetical protein
MWFADFKSKIQEELIHNPDGLTWAELRKRLLLPYDRPCQTWINRMEQDIGLARAKRSRHAYIWPIKSDRSNSEFQGVEINKSAED